MIGPEGAIDFGAIDGTDWDAVVIGAGPAGAIGARRLATEGARVLLVEKSRFPRWKVCGACLNGKALAVLRSAGLGALTDDLSAVDLDEFRVGLRGRTTSMPLPGGVALSRAAFDSALVDAARAAGVACLMESQAQVEPTLDQARPVNLLQKGQSARVRAKVVLVAAGLGNVVMGQEPDGPTVRIARGSRVGAGCVVAESPAFFTPGTIFMAIGKRGYVGLVRVEDGNLNVAAAFDPPFVRHCVTVATAAARILADAGFPPIPALEAARWRGTPTLTRRTSPIAEDRLFLIGDATGYVEPFTGEGMAWALASGEAVAPLALRAIERWDPSLVGEWDDLHGALIRRQQWVCRGLAKLLRRPWLAVPAISIAGRVPIVARFVLRELNSARSLKIQEVTPS